MNKFILSFLLMEIADHEKAAWWKKLSPLTIVQLYMIAFIHCLFTFVYFNNHNGKMNIHCFYIIENAAFYICNPGQWLEINDIHLLCFEERCLLSVINKDKYMSVVKNNLFQKFLQFQVSSVSSVK